MGIRPDMESRDGVLMQFEHDKHKSIDTVIRP